MRLHSPLLLPHGYPMVNVVLASNNSPNVLPNVAPIVVLSPDVVLAPWQRDVVA